MQQHPIPQNVTQYQFRLVGDMTLKQFLELCIGLGLAYLFFASNLIFIIKWPLVILSILFGAGLAFFPIEDRPLDQWIINFIKAIYAPTRFIWQKTNKVPHLFLFEAHEAAVTNTITKTIKAPVAQLTSKSTSDLSEVEATKISSLESLFSITPITPQDEQKIAIQQIEEIEKPTVAIRKLKPVSAVSNVILNIPKTHNTSVEPSPSPSPTTTPSPTPSNIVFAAPTVTTTTKVSTSISTPKKITLPASPKLPNLITGVVVDNENKLVENAIVQIVENGGIPARAMKTNSLGQFYTSTPLSPGTYLIEVDKENLSFSPQQITINNTILSPIELRASS